MAEPSKPKSFSPEGKELEPKVMNQNIPKRSSKKKGSLNKQQQTIPKAVANRMARRVAITTGLPTISGMGVFIASYLLVSRGIADIPPVLTLISSAVCFLTGLLGLSYGIFSASWDTAKGTLLGFENIRPNIKRLRDSLKSSNI